ncbi:hypothetical protein Riv7116_1299 [Rivularia sp. PCC 7116]|uniref:hypothetical protein n=1 Tax=Rivularia sp. PCC 7116 TaxID=373994 RepID=UPI00029ED5EF|nr:hypothetical protein [Rivularia sp. PCC 7116]AFY53865.1 hypothetical protein Riv7116_1299 [Rivularia sp. PCC 7116]
MGNQEKQTLPENPALAEPGKGAPGDNHSAVQMAQTTAVNPPDAIIPSNAPVEQNKQEVNAVEKQEEGTMSTTDGFVIDESGKLDNFAVEPKMYVEDK